MRTLFIGGTKRGFLTLEALANLRADLVGVISLQQDDHETARFETHISSLAEALQIPCFETRRMKDKNYAQVIAEVLRPEITFVVGCRVMIPSSIYTIPRLGTLAVHDSLLPDYRGFAPVNWALINGSEKTGITLFYVNDLVDEGDIVAQKSLSIGRFDDAAQLYDRICRATADLVRDTYPSLAAGTASRRPQESGRGSYACSRTPADGMIDWSLDTARIHNLVRALVHPYPGAFTFLGTRKLFVWRAGPVLDAPPYVGRIPGRVVAIDRTRGSVDVLTGDGILRLERVQLEGTAEEARASDVISSVKVRLGLSTEQLLSRLLELERRLEAVKQYDTSTVAP